MTPVVTFFFISPLLFFFFSSSFFFFCSYFCFPPFDTLFSPRCFFLFSRVSHVINHIHEIHAINVFFFFFFMFLSGWRKERKNYCKVYYFDIKLFLLFLLHYWILFIGKNNKIIGNYPTNLVEEKNTVFLFSFLIFTIKIIFLFLLIHRYQFFLQVKQDILQGRLPVSFDLAAELGAYVVQCKNIIFFYTNF